MAELVVDLLAATGLVAADKLALVRGRAGQGSLAQAIVDEGVAPPRESPARWRSAIRSRSSTSRSRVSTRTRPSRFRCTSSSAWSRSRTRSRTARCGSPSPTRKPARDRRAPARDPLSARPRRRLERGHPRRAAPDGPRLGGVRRPRGAGGGRRRARIAEEEEADDLEAEDGISDAPLVRLVNSVIFQAAEDGASDVHFEPQEDALVVRFRVDGVLQRCSGSRSG